MVARHLSLSVHGLKCQFEIALPVLDSYNLTAFWFVYSSPLDACFDTLKQRIELVVSALQELDRTYNSKDQYREDLLALLLFADFWDLPPFGALP